MIKNIKTFIKNTFLFRAIDYYRQKIALLKWKNKNYPVPAPHAYKQKVIKNYAKNFKINTMVETGTYLGETVRATKYAFKKIYSIELDDNLYNEAKQKFSKFKHINIIKGDSGLILPKILKYINEPCLFWLDGHYSKGITAKGEKNTPIYKELKTILNHKIKNHIILIDDARCFVGKDDYPTIDDLKSYINKNKKNAGIKIKNDIIRIC